MKCIDCEHYNLIEMRCEMNKMCIGQSEFKKRPSKKDEPKEVDIAERLVQAKRAQNAIEAETIKLTLTAYENWLNKCINQDLEIKNLKSAIEDMNSKLLKKNKEINELQAVIKTLGGLL